MSAHTERIIVGVTGSLANLAALHTAVDRARRDGLPVLAVLAWAPVGGEIAYRRAPCSILLQMWEGLAHDRLQTAFDDAFGAVPVDVDINPAVVRASPGRALTHLSRRSGDLLVIGAGRRIGRMRLGVTRYCLRHARCPVMVVERSPMLRELRHHHLDEELRTVLAG